MNIKIIDLTRTLSDGTEAYPGDGVGLRVERLARIDSDGYNLSYFAHLEAHCGTHIDSPLHFTIAGADISEIPLGMPLAVVIEVNGSPIDVEALGDTANLAGRALLLRSGWDREIGSKDYYRHSPYLTPAAAHLLVDSGIDLLGIDFPSPDPIDSKDYPVHHILLEAGIPIVEGLVGLDQLSDVRGEKYFVAFPMKVAGIEGSPVRAAVIVLDSD